MIPRGSAFFGRSREVVKRFLRSVVLVDDRAYETLFATPADVEAPVSPDAAALGGRAHEPGSAGEDGEEVEDDRAHAFDVATITRMFAEHDLLATVAPLQAGERDRNVDIVVRLARRSDVLVLDWRVEAEAPGAFAVDVLRRLREEDRERGGRLRLVVIYTGERDLPAIKKGLCDGLGILRGNPNALSATDGHARYVLLGKPSARSTDDVDYGALPDRIVAEFTELTAGLLSNVALRGFAELRDRTHAVLAQTDRVLDAPYLAHRVHSAPVGAAEDLAVELLVDECASILRNANLQEEVSHDAVCERVEASVDRSFAIDCPSATPPKVEFSETQVRQLLQTGVMTFQHPDHPPASDTEPPSWHQEFHAKATGAFGARMKVNAPALNERFSVFSTQVNVYVQDPSLTLGVLLRPQGQSGFLLCLQPRCDAARISPDGRDFVFVSAESAGTLGFDLIVRVDARTFEKGLVRPGPKSLRLIRFAGGEPHGPVRAVVESGRRLFRDTGGNAYEFLGQLKDGHAQRYANELAAQIARVGVDTFEWLRRSDRSRR